jgi:hypothetical protein
MLKATINRRTLVQLIPLMHIVTLPVSAFFAFMPSRWEFATTSYRQRQRFMVPAADKSFQRMMHATKRSESATQLSHSTIAESAGPQTVNGTSDGSVTTRSPTNHGIDDDWYDFPWSDMQAWTLRDQVPRYTIQVEAVDSTTQKPTIKVYALWRALVNDVPELAGYPIPFLATRYVSLRQAEGADRFASSAIQTITDVLPFLDEFEFTASGGMTGRVYGVQGVADGTRIETSAVGNVEITIPKGFVETHDGLLYELGRPARRPEGDVYSLDAARKSLLTSADLARGLSTTASLRNNLRQRDESAWDPELKQFGALTAIVVVGALAFETLQHHLTVNVFWV